MRFVGAIPVVVGCAGSGAMTPTSGSDTPTTEVVATPDASDDDGAGSRPATPGSGPGGDPTGVDTSATDTGAGRGDSGSDTGATDTAFVPVDCGPIATDGDWEVCIATATTCEATFDDGAGCTEVCGRAGLACVAAYDNVDGQCAGDLASPVDCDSGHQSDYCVCEGWLSTPGYVPPVEECDGYPLPADTLLAEREGFGAHAEGGDPGTIYRVTTLADDGPGSLREGLEASTSQWIVFDVQGEITLDDTVQVASNKTVDGRDRDITVRGHLELEDAHDVILSDLKLTNDLEGHCTQAGDVVTLTGDGGADPSDFSTHDIWLHHLEVFDGGDGLIDLRGATDVTISWSHFHTHEKGLLMDTDRDDGPTEGMRVTMHHNHFDRITRRAPQIAHGWLHTYNNVHYEWYEVGVISIDDAEVVSENNVYLARPGTVCITPCPDPNPCGDDDFIVSKTATSVDWSGDSEGRLRSVGDVVVNGARITERDASSVFEPADHYAYTAEPATEPMGLDIMDRAGARDDICP